jgi:hypothetical protein
MKKFTRNSKFKQQQKKLFFARKGRKFKKPRKFRRALTNLDRFYYGQKDLPQLTHFRITKSKNARSTSGRLRYIGAAGGRRVYSVAAMLRRFIFQRRGRCVVRFAKARAAASAGCSSTLIVSRKYRLKAVSLTRGHYGPIRNRVASCRLLRRVQLNLSTAGKNRSAPRRLRLAVYIKMLRLHQALTVRGSNAHRLHWRRSRQRRGRMG